MKNNFSLYDKLLLYCPLKHIVLYANYNDSITPNCGKFYGTCIFQCARKLTEKAVL